MTHASVILFVPHAAWLIILTPGLVLLGLMTRPLGNLLSLPCRSLLVPWSLESLLGSLNGVLISVCVGEHGVVCVVCEIS